MNEPKDEYWWVEHKAPDDIEIEIDETAEPLPVEKPVNLKAILERLDELNAETPSKNISISTKELADLIEKCTNNGIEKERTRYRKLFMSIFQDSTSGSGLLNKDEKSVYVVYPSTKADGPIKLTLMENDQSIPVEEPQEEIEVDEFPQGFYQDEKGKLYEYRGMFSGWINGIPPQGIDGLEYLG